MKPAGVLSANNNDVKNQDILKYQQTVQLDIKKKVVLPIRLIIRDVTAIGQTDI